MTEEELQTVRRAFARQTLAVAGAAGNARLETVFAETRRERFLGSDPWVIVDVMNGSASLPANDPVYVYQDVLFSLSSDRGVNNGGPSLHARLLNALSPEPAQNVLHLGAGTGYYTAMLAQLVGQRGHVTAVEIDPDLGNMARANLADRKNVDVVIDDCGAWSPDDVDRIYVNFEVTAPLASWIERLSPTGRLVMPLGVPDEYNRPAGLRPSRYGGAFLIERRASALAASYICPAHFVHAEGEPAQMDDGAVDRLQRAFHSGGMEFVKSLVWQRAAAPNRCWFWTPHWSLSYDPA